MAKIKSHSSVEQIAKKHRIDVSFVQKQLKMGIAIEHEHTKDKDLATDIALQHLDEIPDYYTKLKKMEKSAKRSHDRKYKDISEGKRMKSKDPCWDGYEMVGMKKKRGKEVPNCVPVKESTGVRYCPRCNKNETRNECSYGTRFWDLFSQPIRLGNKYTPNTPHPGNMPESYDHEHSMARSELATIASAVKRLRKKMGGEGNIEAWVQSKITKAADYLDSAADYVDSGEMKEQMLPPIDPEKHRRAQKIEKIYNKGKGTDNPHERDTFLKKAGPQLPFAKGKEKVQVAHYEYDNNYIEEDAVQDKFDRRVNAAMASQNPATRIKLLKQAASIHPSKLKTFEQFMMEAKTPAWQRKEGKKKSGGLNKAGVESYRKENPGSKLQTAVTTKPSKLKKGSKSWNRRKSFCSRMSGMKEKLTSAKTARDPNSRINKSLRAWNC